MPLELAEKRKKRFSDFAEEPAPLDGDKMKIDQILNQEVEIIGARIGSTRYSKNKTGKCRSRAAPPTKRWTRTGSVCYAID
jgi:hypothetical protein